MSSITAPIVSPINGFTGGVVGPRHPENLSATITYVTFDGTAIAFAPDAAIAVVSFDGTAASVNDLGCALVNETFDAAAITVTFDGTAVLAGVVDGTLTSVTFDSTTVGWTMQQASITLSEFNDQSIDLAITQSGSPVNLTGQSLQMLLKTAAGTADSGALVLSSTGGSPAIVVTDEAGGLATVTIPSADLSSETYMFYRVDLINAGGLKNTCVYGPITWITL